MRIVSILKMVEARIPLQADVVHWHRIIPLNDLLLIIVLRQIIIHLLCKLKYYSSVRMTSCLTGSDSMRQLPKFIDSFYIKAAVSKSIKLKVSCTVILPLTEYLSPYSLIKVSFFVTAINRSDDMLREDHTYIYHRQLEVIGKH